MYAGSSPAICTSYALVLRRVIRGDCNAQYSRRAISRERVAERGRNDLRKWSTYMTIYCSMQVSLIVLVQSISFLDKKHHATAEQLCFLFVRRFYRLFNI